MKWLTKLDEFLNHEFENSTWADSLNLDSTPETFLKNLNEKEREILIKGFEFLNFSVLEGEYIKNQDEFNDIYRGLHNKVANLQNSVISNDDDFQLSATLNSSQFLYSLKKALEFYKRIADNINKQIDNPQKTIIIDVSDSSEGTGKYFRKKDDVLEESLFDLFTTNLELAHSGFFLVNYNSRFSYLLETKASLQLLKARINLRSTYYNQIIDILIEVCVFFQRKLIIRIGQNEKRYKDKYLFNFEEFDFSLNQHLLENDYFKMWDEYALNHFYSETNKEREIILKKNAEDLIRTKKEITTFLDAHSLIKYYKDLNPNLAELEAILDVFNKFQPKNSFDQYALNISINYLRNNILSFKIDALSLEDLDEFIQDYKILHEKSSINNLFPYYKICRFLKDYIQSQVSFEKLKNLDNRQNLTLAEKALEKLEKCYKLYKENLQWSENHLYFAFQLPEMESKIKIQLDNNIFLEMFIAPGFSLPIDYEKYNEFSEEIKYFLLNSRNEINGLKNISFLTSKLIEKDEEVKLELKNQSRKNIELLGIFSAIIALLFTGVTTANNAETFPFKILTFISMFIVLISFLLLLHFLVNHNKKNN